MLLFLGLLSMLSFANAVQDCYMEKVDLVFVVDESKSVGAENFRMSLEATIEMVNSINVGPYPSDSRIGFVLFSNNARLGFNLASYSTKDQVIKAIRGLTYNGSGTNIARGMEFATREVFAPYARNDSLKIMILLTDGQDSTDVAMQHSLAWENDIVVYAIGVTDGVDINELVNATGSLSKVFTVDNFSDLVNTMQLVCHEIAGTTATPTNVPIAAKSCGCDDIKQLGKKKYWLDVVYAVDTSDSVSMEDFSSIRQMLSTLTGTNIDENPSGQYSRMAIINIGQKAEIFTNLTNHFTKAEYKMYIRNNFQKKHGNSVDIQGAASLASDMFVEEQNANRRSNVKKVFVIFTTEDIECNTKKTIKSKADAESNDLCQVISRLEINDITVVIVAVRQASTHDYPAIDVTTRCNILKNDKNMIPNILRALCRANCFCTKDFAQFVHDDDKCKKYVECVRVQPMSLPFDGASEACENINAKIPDIYSKEKDDFLYKEHAKSGFIPYWIGNMYNNYANRTYENWCRSKKQPDLSEGNCIYVDQCSGFSGAWFTGECDDMMTDRFSSCQVDACSVDNYCSSV